MKGQWWATQILPESGLEDPTGFLTFPISPLLKRPVESNGAGTRAIVDTSAAIPAFLRMQDDGTSAFDRIRDENIRRAAVDTNIATVAYFRVENCRSARGGNIGNSENFHSILH